MKYIIEWEVSLEIEADSDEDAHLLVAQERANLVCYTGVTVEYEAISRLPREVSW